KDSLAIYSNSKDSAKNALKNATDSFTFKVVVSQFNNKNIALTRYNNLRSYNRNVIMYTSDSLTFKIAEPFMRPLSDTTKVSKPAPVKKVVAPKKSATTKKSAPIKKVIAKKSAPAKKVVAKKTVAPKKIVKVVKATKSASKLTASKPSKKTIIKTQKPVKKSAKAVVSNKAVTKKLAPKKKETVKKPSAPAKIVVAKKSVPAKKIVAKKAAPAAKKPIAKVAVAKAPVKQVVAPKAIEHKKEKVVATKKEAAKPIDKSIPKAKVAPPKKPLKPVVVPKTHTDKARKYEPNFVKSVLDQSPEVPQGPTLRYSDNDLTEFRELISKKLETAKKELGYLHGLITRKDQLGGDDSENRYMTMEDGGLSMEREQLGQMASRQITFIDHLEKALMRIENKTYGICRVTGKLIDKARLRAVPHATLSIEAKIGRAHSNI
ncbi:MAG: TraR/DksA C4-type zinc finger protein, partial [Ginsengibacter sp.]